MNQIISTYTHQEAINDGVLAEVLPHRWNQLTHGKPILMTQGIATTISMAGVMEIWNEFVRSKRKQVGNPFTTKMSGKEVWVLNDGQVFTILYPEEN